MASPHTVTKAELCQAIQEKTGWEIKDIRAFIDLFCGEVKQALTEGNSIEMRGFGTFEVRIRKGRSKARNPRTGEPVQVAAHGIAAFRPGRELKTAVWQLKPQRDDSAKQNNSAWQNDFARQNNEPLA